MKPAFFMIERSTAGALPRTSQTMKDASATADRTESDNDKARAEPIVALPFGEHRLHGGQPDHQEPDPQSVDANCPLSLEVGLGRAGTEWP